MQTPLVYTPPEPVSNPDIVLQALARKLSTGASLTIEEKLMAMTASAEVLANNYRPDPEKIIVQQPELPEVVKGILANYLS